MNFYFQHLKNRLATVSQACYPVHSRIHPLRSFHFPFAKCYVKRDDELGFGISGSKIRKYRTLIPFLLANKISEVVVIGSVNSNHVLSIVQLLIENGIKPTLFLRGDPDRSLQGNALFSSLFISSPIYWFSKTEWKNAEWQAYSYAEQQKHPVFVLPEGGFCAEALPGALTLGLDLLENEKESKFSFDHICIEAGTGFMASALILGLSWLKHPACIHVFLLAEDEPAFLARFKICYEMFVQFIEQSCDFPQNFVIHPLKKTKGFGKINTFLFETIAEIASQEGFLTDPIYSAKLFIESKHLLMQGEMQGNVLIHHDGGALTLMGFQHQIQKLQNFY